MIKIIHAINMIRSLKETDPKYGVEIDVRHDNRTGRLYLNHEPGIGDDLEKYLKYFKHRFIIFNIKEAGIEKRCIELAKIYKIPKSKYFLLDVEFPYLYRASRKEGIRELAARYSEAEPIEMALAQQGFVDWIWIDTNTILPLDRIVVRKIVGFKTCLVSPDRWGRPQDIKPYIARIRKLGLHLDAVMVGKEYANLW